MRDVIYAENAWRTDGAHDGCSARVRPSDRALRSEYSSIHETFIANHPYSRETITSYLAVSPFRRAYRNVLVVSLQN